MYSSQTYDVVKNRTLSNIDLNIYKGEGSFLSDMVSPVNSELAKSYNELLFVVIKDIEISSEIEQNTSPVQALEIGIRYNIPANTEFKLQDEISGITKIYNNLAFQGGTEIETDEELKERFYKIQKNQATSGNKAHYEEWALEVEGVYNAKIYPRWDGPGTIKVLIFGENNQAVDLEVIERCREHIEEE
ncbi:baseplate J/gp47 family protein, partial [Clostridioides difficile]|nr:baseplate J/gp47 family protein [Clostridioides difficile]